MNITEKLNEGHSKSITEEIIHYIGNDAKKFSKLIDCFISDDTRIAQRASWPLGLIAEEQPNLLKPYHQLLIEVLKNNNLHNAIRRNIVRIYQVIEIPANIEATLYDQCIQFIADNNEAIAVRAFSIRVCERIIEKYPDLSQELLLIISENIGQWSSGLKNRGNKFLKRWTKTSK